MNEKGVELETIELLIAIRRNLKRWAARYAKAAHAKEQVRETNLQIQAIDALYEKYPHHYKD